MVELFLGQLNELKVLVQILVERVVSRDGTGDAKLTLLCLDSLQVELFAESGRFGSARLGKPGCLSDKVDGSVLSALVVKVFYLLGTLNHSF